MGSPCALTIDPKTGTVFVANEYNDTVSVINGTTHKPIGDPIPVGSHPTALTIDPNTGTLFVANEYDDTVSVINGTTHESIGDPIPVGSGPCCNNNRS